MFNLFKSAAKKPAGETVILKIGGMHCPSCALNIDGTLEDLPGVIEATTNYAKSQTKVVFNPTQTTIKQLAKTITDLDYSVS